MINSTCNLTTNLVNNVIFIVSNQQEVQYITNTCWGLTKQCNERINQFLQIGEDRSPLLSVARIIIINIHYIMRIISSVHCIMHENCWLFIHHILIHLWNILQHKIIALNYVIQNEQFLLFVFDTINDGVMGCKLWSLNYKMMKKKSSMKWFLEPATLILVTIYFCDTFIINLNSTWQVTVCFEEAADDTHFVFILIVCILVRIFVWYASNFEESVDYIHFNYI